MERFSLTTTERPRKERRPRPRPTLTVERGPRDAGRVGVTLEPDAPKPLGVCSTRPAPSDPVSQFFYVRDAETNATVAELRLLSQARVMDHETIAAFLWDIAYSMIDAGYRAGDVGIWAGLS